MASLNEILQAINKHIEEGAIDDAMILCRQALSRAPRSPRVLKTYGACLMASGDMQAASTSFQAALAIDPDDAAASHDLGLTLHARQDIEGARLAFERAITIAPQHAASHEALAAILVEQGDMDAALRHMLIAVEVNPNDAGTLANFAAVLSRIGAFFDAKAHLERALKLDPGNAGITLPLAQIMHELGEHQEAVALVEKAYLKRPRDPITLAALAFGLAQIGDLGQALEHLAAALKSAPDLVPALDTLALISAYRGEPEKGIAHIAGLLKGQKANPLLFLSLSAAMARDGRHEEAITLAGQALQQPMTRSGAYVLMRQNLALLGRFDELIALSKTLGAGKRPEAENADAPVEDAVIVPLETRPLDVVLLARFLKLRDGDPAMPAADAVLYAPEQLSPLLSRVDSGRQISPLRDAGLARPGAGFIAHYAMDERLLTYRPETFAPYIKADPRANDFWRGSLAPLKRPLVGITWAKYPPAALLEDLREGLRDWPGTILSLVWDDQRAELEGNRRIIDAGRHLQSLDALIDLIGKLDYVVAPDGLAMHIAGAMGVPGLVLTTPDKGWYWHEQDGRSYWYPSIRVLTRPWQVTPEAFRPRIAEAARSFLEGWSPAQENAAAGG